MKRIYLSLMLVVLAGVAWAAGPYTRTIAAAAHNAGVGGVGWQTDLDLLNTNATAKRVTIELLLANQANPAPLTATVSVPAGQTVRIADILANASYFNASNAALGLNFPDGEAGVQVVTRFYNTKSTYGGTFGMYVPAEPISRAVAYGTPAYYNFLAASSSDASGYRTNVGFANATGTSTRVKVTLFDGAAKTQLGSVEYTLRAYEHYQFTRIFGYQTVGKGYVKVEVLDAGGKVFCYAMLIDNMSGDPILIPYYGGSGNGTATNSGDLYAVDSIVGNLRYVKAGTFTQGSPVEEYCRGLLGYGDETQFSHTLTRNYAVMQTEVTRARWAALRAVQPSLPEDPSHEGYSPSGTYPVNNLDWYEAVKFANLLSQQQGLTPCYYSDSGFTSVIGGDYNGSECYCNFAASGYRLPTEGEWEFMCRAGTTGAFYVTESGYDGSSCLQCTAGLFPALEATAVFCATMDVATGCKPVGGKTANPWNLQDIIGNVDEWTWDVTDDYPAGPSTDYTGPSTGEARAIRGGHFEWSADTLRSAFRSWNNPVNQAVSVGFRLVRTVN